MTKEEIVQAGVAAIQSAQVQAISDQLGIAVDSAIASVPPSAGGFSQADIDTAVAAAKAVDAEAMASAKSASDAALADMQSKLDALKGQEESAIAELQESMAKAQAAIAAVMALLPAPVV
ncbi:MAG: hypothetical protein ACXWQJ_14095 [Bdellovibrionota bacterium]